MAAKRWAMSLAGLACLLVAALVPLRAEQPSGGALRVGVTPEYPPFAYRAEQGLRGAEVDLARRLGARLGRRVELVELRWEDQIPALLEDRIDIVMSGMSVTPERARRVAFTAPYFVTGLGALMRVESYGRFASAEDLVASFANVGTLKGTTAAQAAGERLPAARTLALLQLSDGPAVLERGEIDAFVHDLPAIIWLAAEWPERYVAVRVPDSEQVLAWAVHPRQRALLEGVNAALEAWKRDASLSELMAKWLPAAAGRVP